MNEGVIRSRHKTLIFFVLVPIREGLVDRFDWDFDITASSSCRSLWNDDFLRFNLLSRLVACLDRYIN